MHVLSLDGNKVHANESIDGISEDFGLSGKQIMELVQKESFG